MSVINSIPLIAAGDDGYQISRSVRLRSSASAYFNRTMTTPTNSLKWTWNGWVKLGALTGYQDLFFAGTSGSAYGGIWFNSGTLCVSSYNGSGYPYNVTSVPVYRDPSAWYMVTIVYDSTQATNTNRIQMWVNNQQITSFTSPTWPTQNTSYQLNTAVQHNIGNGNVAGAGYFDGYLTEINFIDGQALTPSSFGENDAVTGVWKPKKYAGTYGTNGFYLNFSDNSAATAAAIGKDSSGNGNNWTPNNISVTSGVTYDSMIDTPTMYADGGNGRGNYCVINPIDGTFPDAKPTNGNLTQSSSTNWNTVRATIGVSSGKWYWETVHSVYNQSICGIADGNWPTSTYYPGYSSTGYSAGFGNAGYKYVDGAAGAVYGTAFVIGDVIGYALDMDAGTLTCYINGVSQGTMVSGLTGTIFPAIAAANTAVINANFGQRPFAYTPPTGFKALNTQNLPDSTIKKGNQYFDVSLYTGNATARNITNSGAMQPDLVWIKERSAVGWNIFTDSVRGVTKNIYSNSTNAEATNNGTDVTSFNTDGFSLGTDSNGDGVNRNGNTVVAWQWKKGATQGFDIVTYTGTGANTTVAHSLGVAPSMIILKQRNAVDYWVAWHSALANTEYLLLNSTNAKSTAATYWNSTSPTSSVFSLGTDSRPNGSGTTYVAYLFAEVAGFSKFGSYTGNGSADGPFVYCGFRPKFILTKDTSAVGAWLMHDTSRDPYNTAINELQANASNAEYTTTGAGAGDRFDILSNGFKNRTSNAGANASGSVIIYAAFAENPFKNSLAR